MSSSKNANNVSQHSGGIVFRTEMYKMNRSFAQPTPSAKKVEASVNPTTEDEKQQLIEKNTKDPNPEDKNLIISEDLSKKKNKKLKNQEEESNTEDLESE